MTIDVPTCDLRLRIGRIRAVASLILVLGLAVGGCSAGRHTGGCPPDEACEDEDAGPPGEDAGPAVDGGAEPSPPLAGFSERGGGVDDSCADGLDNDSQGGTDCEDRSSCGASAYCCVGSTDDACCAMDQDLEVDFAGCAADSVEACSGVLSSFGAPSPQLEGGLFVPNGDGLDSGIVIGGPVAPETSQLDLRATFETPTETCNCADAAAIGLGLPPTDENPRPVFDVAVMARRAYGDIALVIAGEVVWSLPYTSAQTTVTLQLRPDGTLTLDMPDVPDMEPTEDPVARWAPRPGRRVMLYGQTPNRTDQPVHTAIASAHLTSKRCEVPRALERDATPTAVSGHQPSVARFEAVLWMATASEGQVAFHQQTTDGWEPIASAPMMQDGLLSNPELEVEEGRLVLYAEATTTEEGVEVSSIVRFERGDDGGWSAPSPVTLPAGNWGQPSLLRSGSSRWLAATHYDDGAVAVFQWNDTERVFLETYRLHRGTSLTDFHQDEVADPELVEDGRGVMRLYYAGRRGTRWAIGVQISENGRIWRDPGLPGEAVLSSSGQGHDALGVRSPSVLIEDQTLRLYHTASDGLLPRVGMAGGATW